MWIAATGYFIGENLCAATMDLSQQTGPAPLMLAKLTRDPFDTVSTIDCFPTDGKTAVAWASRQWALTRILGVPIASFLLGYALLWGIKGFKQPI